MLHAIAEEPRAALGIADGDQHLSVCGTDNHPSQDEGSHQSKAGQHEQCHARALRLHVEAEDILEIRQAVIAAKAHIVAEEGEEQGIGQRLRDDREIDTRHAGAEGEPAEHKGQQARREQHHQHGIGEEIEAPPGHRQLLVVQEDHEIRQDRVTIDPARADLPHEIHAHGIAAEREERAVAKAEDAAIAPGEIKRDREHCIGQVFAEQHHGAGGDVKRRARRECQIPDWHQQHQRRQHDEEHQSPPLDQLQEAHCQHGTALTARPRGP